MELAAASVTDAEVKEREAERTLAATKITAPIDGTVLSVGGTVGGQVTGQSKTAFITLGDLDDLQVQAMFPLGEVNRLKLGQPATISLAMLAGHTYRGTVTRIDPAATTSGTRALFGVMVSLDETPPPGLRTGMSATVEVVTAQADSTLYVPAGAVHPKSGGTATVLIRQVRPHPRPNRPPGRTRRPLRRHHLGPFGRRPRGHTDQHRHGRLPRRHLPGHLTNPRSADQDPRPA